MTTLEASIAVIDRNMRLHSKRIHTATWQSVDISKRPEAQMVELTNIFFKADMTSEDLDYYRRTLKPNLPWADKHFVLERISGEPINPGTTWKEWPFGHSASNFLESDGVFSHSYAERYWPKIIDNQSMRGIRYSYGDLYDVVSLIAKDPLTRQAYLPVWFPEDTGVVHGKRVPCTLGYHFMVRNGKLNVFYPIRSCDRYRHFNDDIYLTVRLTIWILQQLRTKSNEWSIVKLGEFSMWIGSLHMFINDWRKKYGKDIPSRDAS